MAHVLALGPSQADLLPRQHHPILGHPGWPPCLPLPCQVSQPQLSRLRHYHPVLGRPGRPPDLPVPCQIPQP